MNEMRNNELKEQAYDIWYKIFGSKFKVTYENRLFGLYESGEIQNPDDKKRNVSFKVVTFLNFLNKFYDTLMNRSKKISPGKDEAEYKIECDIMMNEALSSAGLQCGMAFGEALFEQLKRDKKFKSPDWRISQWCEFDTRAGFGRMDYIEKEKIIEIQNLFIHDFETTEDRDYIVFFLGYMLGVLINLTDEEKLTELKIKIIKNHNTDKKDFKVSIIKNNKNINYAMKSITNADEFDLYIIKEVESGHDDSF